MNRGAIVGGWSHVGRHRIWVRVPAELARRANGNGNGAAPALPAETPVVLVHGLAGSSRSMAPLLRRLDGDRPALAPDMPGFGLSDPPPRPLDIPGLAQALRRWMLEHDLAPAALVAESTGCQVALELAASHPELVERLVLVGPCADPGLRGNPGGFARRWLRGALHNPRRMATTAIRDVLDAGPWRAAQSLRFALEDKIEEKLDLVSAPTLIVRGARDLISSDRCVQHLAERIADARVQTLPRAPHLPRPRDLPRLAEMIESFLAGEAMEAGDESSPEPSGDAKQNGTVSAQRNGSGHARWIVDGMNVIGSRPDGWWRDRQGAWRRLQHDLEQFARESGDEVQLVLDGRRPAKWPDHGVIETAFAGGKRDAADDAIVARVAADPHPESLRVVTSDRELERRVVELGAEVVAASSFRETLASD